MKKLFAILCMAALLLSMTACQGAKDDTIKVGVCQLTPHVALDAATEGFVETLKAEFGDKIEIDVQVGGGDTATCSPIVNAFVSDGVDLIMANATPAMLACATATADIPVLATSITNYESAMEIELTETALVRRVEPLAALVSSIRANGFRVALDNFGRGFSSLGLLKSIVVDTVKIDSSLTAPSDSEERDSTVVSHLVALCHELSIRTVAEGIETETQRLRMSSYGFDMLQGTHLSCVIHADEFEQLLIDMDESDNT